MKTIKNTKQSHNFKQEEDYKQAKKAQDEIKSLISSILVGSLLTTYKKILKKGKKIQLKMVF